MRKSLKKVLAVVLTSVIGLSLSGCGSTTTSTANTTTNTTTEKETTEEKNLVVGLGKLGVLDPPVCTDNTTSTVLLQMYTPLFRYNAASEIVPVGVDTYEISDDGLVYTFHLRQDMKWSDGEPLTAHHYEYGFKRSLGYGPEAISGDLIGVYVKNATEPWTNMADVKDMEDVGIKALDDYTLEITLEQSTSFYLPLLVRNVYMPLREDYATEHNSEWALGVDAPTCGAFKLVELNEAGDTILEKDPSYFDAENVKLDTITFTAMDDTNAQLLAFQNGDLDVALNLDLASVKAVYAGQPEFVLGNDVANYYMQFNVNEEVTTNPALLNVNVRRAIAMAINREDITIALDTEEEYLPLHGQVPPQILGESGYFREEQDADGIYIEYDVEGAKALMAEAGYTPENPLKIEYYTNSNTMNDTIAVVMQSQLAEIGVNMELKVSESKVFFDERDNQGLFEIARSAYSAALLDPYNFLEQFVSTHQSLTIYNDERVDQLIEDSSAEMDVKKRMDMLKEAEEIIVEENVWTVPLISYTKPYLVSTDVEGFEVVPTSSKFFTYVDMK